MEQGQIAGIIVALIGLLLEAVPKCIWKLTESWKNKGETEPSRLYLSVVRGVGACFLIVGIVLSFGIIS